MSETGRAKLTVISEDAALTEILESVLQEEFRTTTISGESVARDASGSGADVVLLDISPGCADTDPEGIISALAASRVPVIIMADDDTRNRAMELLACGAEDYVRKPPALRELKRVLQKACERHGGQRRPTSAGQRDNAAVQGLDQLVGMGAPMQLVYKLIRKVAGLDASVLITGESGTGKELIARAIHNTGNRARRPFVAVSCGAIPETLIEAELFGHEKGAFTGTVGVREGYLEKAGDGTLLLDEIGELNQPTQVALLRVLQQREFSRLGSSRLIPLRARIVFATHRDLGEMVAAGRFREDLYYRINVMNIRAPALRDHSGDIPVLAEHFVRKYSLAYGKTVEGINPDALALLQEQPWPGNIRELENVLQRAIIMAETDMIQAPDLMVGSFEPHAQGTDCDETDAAGGRFERMLRDYKKKIAIDAIESCHGNKTMAAQTLSISRAYLHRLIRPASAEDEEAEEETDHGHHGLRIASSH